LLKDRLGFNKTVDFSLSPNKFCLRRDFIRWCPPPPLFHYTSDEITVVAFTDIILILYVHFSLILLRAWLNLTIITATQIHIEQQLPIVSSLLFKDSFYSILAHITNSPQLSRFTLRFYNLLRKCVRFGYIFDLIRRQHDRSLLKLIYLLLL
jgi:hypothetical protein